ncbi:uncharacterized protein [Drosophila bipectinata]|uniref:uncharacterized protein n=1 Tax=Drosophila bipectinata TaxID=42026 RepID=UPI0038B2B153
MMNLWKSLTLEELMEYVQKKTIKLQEEIEKVSHNLTEENMARIEELSKHVDQLHLLLDMKKAPSAREEEPKMPVVDDLGDVVKSPLEVAPMEQGYAREFMRLLEEEEQLLDEESDVENGNPEANN